MKLAPTYLLVIMLAGCATPKPPEIRYVQTPRPVVVIPSEPHYPIEDVKARTAKQQAQDAAVSFQAAVGYIDELLPLINPEVKP